MLTSDPTPYCIRPAVAADATALRKVYASTRAPELAALGWSAAQCTAFLEMQFLAQDQHYRQCYPDAHFSVIEFEGAIVGRLSVLHGSDAIRLIDIALLPEFRRRGWGRDLLTRLQAQARQRGVPLRLQVARDNPAQALYTRLGFTAQGGDAIYCQMEWGAPPEAPADANKP